MGSAATVRECPSPDRLPETWGQLPAFENFVAGSLYSHKVSPNWMLLKEWRYHQSITWASYASKFGSLPNLTFLSLTDCPSLERLMAGFGDLSSLDWNFVKDWVDCPRLSANSKSLNILTIYTADNLTELFNYGNLAELASVSLISCPSLEILLSAFGFLPALEKLEQKQCAWLQRLSDSTVVLTFSLKSLSELSRFYWCYCFHNFILVFPKNRSAL